MDIRPDIQDPTLLPEKFRYLQEWMANNNIAEELSQDELDEIGQQVCRGYEIDKDSRSEWERTMEEAMKIAKQVKEEKSFPWPNAANVKYPLITHAVIQFAARAYPEIIQGHETVKCMVVGEDPDGLKEQKASRVAKHMSWQLTDQMEEWEEEADRLFHVLPVSGLCYKKTYYCRTKQRNASELVLPSELVVNYHAKSLSTTRRVTQEYLFYKNDIYERVHSGQWLDILDDLPKQEVMEGHENDEDAPYLFLEQHRWWDLDEDGYEEPYTVMVHKDTGRVVRITARFNAKGVVVKNGRILRIEAHNYYTKFGFIPNPDGSFYDLGFGLLLNPLNESVNTVINQLLDAGTLANTGGGFLARGIRMRGGPIKLAPGEWKPVDTPAMDLRQGIVPIPRNEPSNVLFSLLGLLIDAAKDITAVKDVLTGEQPGQNVPATTVLALIEQGMKVFSAIYKRIFRSFTKEFKSLFHLNSLYLSDYEYFNVLDSPYAVSRLDYDEASMDIKPSADPTVSSDAQRMARAQALMVFVNDPDINQPELKYRYLDAIKTPQIEKLLIPPDQKQDVPDPKVLEAQLTYEIEKGKLELDQHRVMLEEVKMQIEAARAQAEIARHQGQAMELQARAAKYGAEAQNNQDELHFEALAKEIDAQVDLAKKEIDYAIAKLKTTKPKEEKRSNDE